MGKRKIEVNPGDKFNRLTVISETESRRHPNGKPSRYINCRCECGNEVTVSLDSLHSGKTKSCGCLQKEITAEAHYKHGASKTRLHNIWIKMRGRCEKEYCAGYKYYGSRGIKVCNEWQEFVPFRDWALNNGYRKDLTIERVDVNGNYCPENCCWTPLNEQMRNRTDRVWYTYNGKTQLLSGWAKDLNTDVRTLWARIHVLGWSIEDTLTLGCHERN